MKTDRNTTARNVAADLVIPALALVFTLYYLTTITEVPWIAQASAVAVSGLLLLSILAFAIRTVLRIREGTETIQFATKDYSSTNRRTDVKRIVLLMLTLGFLLLLPHAGFTVSTFIFIFSGVITLSSTANWPRALALSAICSSVGYLVFIHLFKTRFPHGVVENLLKGLFQQ